MQSRQVNKDIKWYALMDIKHTPEHFNCRPTRAQFIEQIMGSFGIAERGPLEVLDSQVEAVCSLAR